MRYSTIYNELENLKNRFYDHSGLIDD